MSAAGRPVTRLGAVPRAIAPPMASKDRNEEYARLKAEFDTMQAEMDALGIGASSKKLEEFEVWRRRRAAKRYHLVGNARRDNSRAIVVPRRQRQRPPLLRREARVPMPGPRCAATRTSLLHTSLLHCSRDSRPVRLRSVPGQRRRSPVCGESRASPSARSWPPSGKCCPGLRSRTTSTSLARRVDCCESICTPITETRPVRRTGVAVRVNG